MAKKEKKGSHDARSLAIADQQLARGRELFRRLWKLHPDVLGTITRTIDLHGYAADEFLQSKHFHPEQDPFTGWDAVKDCLASLGLRYLMRADLEDKIANQPPPHQGE